MTKREKLCYLAGLVDGEGYVGITKNKPYRYLTGRINPGYHEKIQVRMIANEGLNFLAKELGGWLFREKPSANEGRPLYCFQASDQKAASILKILLPFLLVKRKSAIAVLRLRELKNSAVRIRSTGKCKSRWGTMMRKPGGRHSKSEITKRDKLWLLCKKLNRPHIFKKK